MNFFLFKMLREKEIRNHSFNSCESKKYETMPSALAQIILLICPILIQFSYFLVDNLKSRYGQQYVSQLLRGCNFWQGTGLKIMS